MKTMFSIFILALTLLSTIPMKAQMTLEWTTRMPAADLPDDWTPPEIDAMTLPKKHTGTINMPASLDNADDTLAVLAIGEALMDSIELNYLVQDFRIDTSLDSKGQILITDIERRFDTFAPGNKRGQYTVATPVFKVSWTFRWRKDP